MFSFVNGLLALGALGGAIPVIIHLLNRRRFKITRWAAMEFLLASFKKNYRRVRMENLLLLLLRVLLVILIAFALARPRLSESGMLGSLGAESRHAIILLDDSLSMQYRVGSATSFDRARRAALDILDRLGSGDVVSVLAVSDVTRPIIQEASLEIDLARHEVKRATAGWGGTDMSQALAAAAELLDSSRKARKEVYVITDMQANAWPKEGEEPSAELQAALKRLQKEATVFFIDAAAAAEPGEVPRNLAVTRCAPVSKIVGTGSPTEFTAEVANFGPAKESELQVRCFVDHSNQGSKIVDVEAGGTDTATFTPTFGTKGSHLVEAELGKDRLDGDNVRYLAVNAVDFIRALLVNGETAPEIHENETYFLERALKEVIDLPGVRVSSVEPTTITEFGLSSADFSPYQLVVLANLPSLVSENVRVRLEDFVKEGGGLIVFLGDRVDAAFYNEQLFKDGKGLLPARIGEEMGSVDAAEGGPVHLELTKPVHPAFALFTGDLMSLVTRSVLFYKYHALELPESKEDVRVAATFEDGTPAVVEKTYGRGRVMLFASSCDTEWNNFAKTAAYVVVIQELVGHMVTSDYEQRNVLVHQPYRRTFAPEELVDTVAILPPGGTGSRQTLRPYVVGASPSGAEGAPAVTPVTQIVYDATDVAGSYKLEITRADGSRAPVEYFCVNVPPAESDLRRCTPEDVSGALKGFDFKYVKNVSDLNLAVKESRKGREFTEALLLAVLALACAELVLAQRFGR